MMNVTNNAKKIDLNAIVARRLKRLSSIALKLRMNNKMELARMQDIGGGRAILKDENSAYRIVDQLLKGKSKCSYKLIKDYIKDPKESGYRGIHLIAKYDSSKNTECNGMVVEIQVRNITQHIWATGVETVGAILNSPLKSSVGPDEWKKYFNLLGESLALTDGVKAGTKFKWDKYEEFNKIEAGINAQKTLMIYGNAIKSIDDSNKDKRHKQFLLYFKPAEGRVDIRGYLGKESQLAIDDYKKWEQAARGELGENVVLVKVNNIRSLKTAYPNYFADTTNLCQRIQQIHRALTSR